MDRHNFRPAHIHLVVSLSKPIYSQAYWPISRFANKGTSRWRLRFLTRTVNILLMTVFLLSKMISWSSLNHDQMIQRLVFSWSMISVWLALRWVWILDERGVVGVWWMLVQRLVLIVHIWRVREWVYILLWPYTWPGLTARINTVDEMHSLYRHSCKYIRSHLRQSRCSPP